MTMVEVRLELPEEHVAAVSRLIAELMTPEPPAPIPWTEDLALAAIKHIVSRAEYDLLRRMAEARGQRVPMSELASGMGLPGTPDTAQDFAGLSAWCSADAKRPQVPVVNGGEGTDGWYWMPIEASDRFLTAYRKRHGGS
jgi:hypothetical protein